MIINGFVCTTVALYKLLTHTCHEQTKNTIHFSVAVCLHLSARQYLCVPELMQGVRCVHLGARDVRESVMSR